MPMPMRLPSPSPRGAARAPLPPWRRRLPWLLLALALAGLAREGGQALQRQALVARVAAELAAPRPPAASAPGVGAASATAAASAADAASAASGAAPAAPDWLADGAPPLLRFGQALGFAQAGQDEPALARYRTLYDDPALGRAARFNAANVLLRRAIALREAGHADTAYPMIELAKEGYRQVLRQRPEDPAARYNLERAQRLIPEADADSGEAKTPEHAERAATTMRSVSQGLP